MSETNIFISAMRKLAGGVSVITTDDGSNKTGMTVTSVISIAVDPAYFMLTINPKSSTWAIFEKSHKLGINFLGEQHDKVAIAFSGFTGIKGADKFNEGQWILNNGVWVLVDALASFSCLLDEVIARQGHNIVIVKVEHTNILEKHNDSLVYKNGAYWKLQTL